MEENIALAIQLLAALVGSSVLVALMKNSQENERKHKEIIANASKSVLKRVEMYYRIRRRTNQRDDVINIRNIFHEIQEENEYYKTLLVSESKWHGERYSLYITAIQKLTASETQKAWKQKPFGPSAEIGPKDRPDYKRINELSMQFAKDSRRLTNPFMRILMRVRDSWLVTRVWKITAYGH
jgi:uncharacterized protein with PIN domain